ncbi:MAG TPA: patatin family protein [Methanocorpusculum sp.]|nr:patatin family protein [Methanocorpusculum sp.]
MLHQAGLILEGGGMRGVYTAGALDALIENDLQFSAVYAVSSGACHAVSYISQQKGRAYRANTQYADDWHFCGLRCFLTTGSFFGWKMMYKINSELDPLDFDAYEKYPGTFYAVATSLRTGLAAYLPVTADDLRTGIDKVRASCAIPYVSTSVSVNGRRYLDGCISNSIPVKKSMKDGNTKNVVILARHRGYRKLPHTILQELFYYIRYLFSPGYGIMCLTRFIRYNRTLRFIKAEEKAGRLFVLAPKKRLHVGSLSRNKKKLQKAYEAGYAETMERMAELKKYLES